MSKLPKNPYVAMGAAVLVGVPLLYMYMNDATKKTNGDDDITRKQIDDIKDSVKN
jgi:hypothetical protein